MVQTVVAVVQAVVVEVDLRVDRPEVKVALVASTATGRIPILDTLKQEVEVEVAAAREVAQEPRAAAEAMVAALHMYLLLHLSTPDKETIGRITPFGRYSLGTISTSALPVTRTPASHSEREALH